MPCGIIIRLFLVFKQNSRLACLIGNFMKSTAQKEAQQQTTSNKTLFLLFSCQQFIQSCSVKISLSPFVYFVVIFNFSRMPISQLRKLSYFFSFFKFINFFYEMKTVRKRDANSVHYLQIKIDSTLQDDIQSRMFHSIDNISS